MDMTTFTSRAFNQDTSKAKRLAKRGPVFITDRGKPAHVLLNIEEYKRLTKQTTNIVDLLAMPETDEIDFEAPKLDKSLYQAADLS